MLNTNALALIELEETILKRLVANPSDSLARAAEKFRIEAQSFHDQNEHEGAARREGTGNFGASAQLGSKTSVGPG